MLQEAYARAFVRWSRVGACDLPEAWVRRVAINLAAMADRSLRRRAGRPAGHPVPSPATDVSGAGMLTGHWFGRADAPVFLAQHVEPARRQAIHDRIQGLDVDAVFFESRQEAYDRVKVLYRNRPDAFANVGPEAMPESFRVRLDDPDHFQQLFRALCQPDGSASGRQRCVRGVVYETPAQAFRRLPDKWRKPSGNTVTPVLGPEAMHGSFRVTLDDPIPVSQFHQALCGSRKTGDCPFGLVLLDNRPRRDQATGAGAVRVRP